MSTWSQDELIEVQVWTRACKLQPDYLAEAYNYKQHVSVSVCSQRWEKRLHTNQNAPVHFEIHICVNCATKSLCAGVSL